MFEMENLLLPFNLNEAQCDIWLGYIKGLNPRKFISPKTGLEWAENFLFEAVHSVTVGGRQNTAYTYRLMIDQRLRNEIQAIIDTIKSETINENIVIAGDNHGEITQTFN